MRRMMFLLVAVSFLGSLAGCKLMHSHGVCDCEQDNHCADRAPWVRTGPPITMASEPIATPPTKTPDVPKKDL
jgi:hypothetical protein